jgi:Tol biopolymer transport system component
MRRFAIPFLASTVLTALLIAAACSTPTEPPETPPEPTFQPGEYGGDPLPSTEHITIVEPSPSGDRFALIRRRTPGKPSNPRFQLWMVDRDGSDPRLIGLNIHDVAWHPSGDRLVVTVAIGIDFYVYTIDLETMETTQWTGKESQRLSFPVVSMAGWFQDGYRLLVFVNQKAYQQPFPRGLYVIDTRDSTTTDLLVELFSPTRLGNQDRYTVGKKYVRSDDSRSGNFARYDFNDESWHWITDFPKDSLRSIQKPVPSPTSDLIVQARENGNAKQLFLMNHWGGSVRQITELGGDIPVWNSDGSYVMFRRDVNRGSGARYVPFKFDMQTMEASPLWPALPDSVPDFPPLSSQSLSQTLNPR